MTTFSEIAEQESRPFPAFKLSSLLLGDSSVGLHSGNVNDRLWPAGRGDLRRTPACLQDGYLQRSTVQSFNEKVFCDKS
jgi:hypothetical protein